MTPDKNHLPAELAAKILEREAAQRAAEIPEDTRELVTLLAEECAEGAQACTKILRFGLTINPWTGKYNRDVLEYELGDVIAAIRALHALGVVDIERILRRADRKLHALRADDGRLRHARIPEGA